MKNFKPSQLDELMAFEAQTSFEKIQKSINKKPLKNNPYGDKKNSFSRKARRDKYGKDLF